MEKYNFVVGEDLYRLAVSGGIGVINVHLNKGIDPSDALHVFEEVRLAGTLIHPYTYGEWIPWSGGDCPVPKDTRVDVKIDNKVRLTNEAGRWNWNVEGEDDITHYRLSVKEERQTGRTTKQIKNAPKGSYYVTMQDRVSFDYTLKLVTHLGRQDLQLVRPTWLHEQFRGVPHNKSVIVDHAVGLTPQQSENLKRFDKPKYVYNPKDVKMFIGDKEIKTGFSVDNDTNSGNMDTQFKQQEDTTMTTRNLMTATLVDCDKGLEIDQSLVYSTEVMVEGDDTQTAIQELIFTDVVLGERITEHNKKRKKTINLEVLERTGQEVFLRPKKISELTWAVK